MSRFLWDSSRLRYPYNPLVPANAGMDTGLRRENATKQKHKSPFRFNRNGTLERNAQKMELPRTLWLRAPRPLAGALSVLSCRK